jgi:hypothetical protein
MPISAVPEEEVGNQAAKVKKVKATLMILLNRITLPTSSTREPTKARKLIRECNNLP